MKLAGLLLIVTSILCGLVYAQQNQNTEVGVLHVRGPIYMLVGAGGNITVSVGPDGVLIVDTGTAAISRVSTGATKASMRPSGLVRRYVRFF